jgi:hypothetical protein
MKTEQSIYILYSQIAVFQADLENPFNDWSTDHVLQGFAWRPQSVSFKTLEEDGDLRVVIEIKEAFDKTNEKTLRAIRVPFTAKGTTEIASISEGFKVQVPDGDYSLYFETGRDRTGMWSLLTFVNEYHSEAEILICDDQLNPGKKLLMTAKPAD